MPRTSRPARHDVNDRWAGPLPTLAVFAAFGLALYVVPLWGVPNPDVITFYRYWAAPRDPALLAAIPAAWHETGSVPYGPLELFFRSWYPSTGRFDIAAIQYFWWAARVFGDSPDVWRTLGTLSLSLSIALTCLVAVRLGVPRTLAFVLGVALMVAPLGWERGIESELRAALLVMLACYLTLVSASRASPWVAALSILAAVLTKETFVSAWALLVGLALFRVMEMSVDWRDSLRRLMHVLAPHGVVIVILGLFVAIMRLGFEVKSDYAFEGAANAIPIGLFARTYLAAILPPFEVPVPVPIPLPVAGLRMLWSAQITIPLPWGAFGDHVWPLPIPVGAALTVALSIALLAGLCLLALAAAARLLPPGSIHASLRGLIEPRGRVLVIAALVVAIALHAVPYYFTGREVRGHYQTPANLYMALLIGLLLAPLVQHVISPVVRRVSGRWPAVAPWTILIAAVVVCLIGSVDRRLEDGAQYRLDMEAWRGLTDAVNQEAPRGAHVVITMESTSGGEGAGLIAQLLLDRRYDLVFHWGSYPPDVCERAAQACRQNDAFNASQPPLPAADQAPVVDVSIVRLGRPSGVPLLPDRTSERWWLLLSSPLKFAQRAYLAGKTASLGWTIARR